ncbi:hypothetical protein ACP275_11G113100 [Erythranthe tilingii]
MKFQPSELPIGKPQPRRRTSKLAPLVALTILLTIPLYYPSIKDSTKKLSVEETSQTFESSLDDSIKPSLDNSIEKPTSHLETSPIENPSTNPCSDDPAECSNVDKSRDNDDDVAAEVVVPQPPPPPHHQSPQKKKHEKGGQKHKKPARKYSSSPSSSSSHQEIVSRGDDRGAVRERILDDEQCDLFSGEWVPDPDGPYYTNDTCNAIQEHQNCLKFGRPDRGFLKWRWKPDDCEMPVFDPTQFLELVRGKSIAFVGDSVARNHMQSLICLLSRVAIPVDLSDPLDQNRRYEFRDHDFNISMFWAPYLVRTEKTDPKDEKRPFNLYLDEFDRHWQTGIAAFDYLIISAGHWFFRPTYFYLDGRLAGCLYCPDPNVPHLTSYFSYRRAFRTAFSAINAAGFAGVTFLRSYAPSHFEGAAWDKGGDCVRTRPFRKDEIQLSDYSLEMYLIQLEELRIAQKVGRRTGGKFRLFDATRAMLLRPDGHPSKYGHLQGANQSFANDCVHWCLPGPIDAWNDFLQELLKREVGDSR